MASKFRTTYGKGVAVELMSNSIDNGSLAHLSIDREIERESANSLKRAALRRERVLADTCQTASLTVLRDYANMPPRPALIDKWLIDHLCARGVHQF